MNSLISTGLNGNSVTLAYVQCNFLLPFRLLFLHRGRHCCADGILTARRTRNTNSNEPKAFHHLLYSVFIYLSAVGNTRATEIMLSIYVASVQKLPLVSPHEVLEPL